MFIAALCTIARTQKQPRCPLTDEWMKLWCIYTMEYYSAIKRNALSQFYEVVELRVCYTEGSKSERGKQSSYINMYIWNLEKWY